MKSYTLKNGFKILYYPINTSYSIAISLNINAGVFLENNENNGITHLLEHLHFRRLGNMDQNELYYRMDKIGSNLNAATYKELLRFYTKIRPKYLYDVLEMFQNILTMYEWNEKDIEDEKNVVLNEINEKKNYFDMHALVDSIVLRETPFYLPVIGTKESVMRIGIEEIIEYKKKIFSAENIALVVTGNFDEKDMCTINKKFENINLGVKIKNKVKELQIQKPQIKIFNTNLSYPCVVLSFFIKNDISNSGITLLNSILGGGTGSILQRNIREKYGLSYDIYSYIECYSEISLLNIYFSCDIKNIYICLQQIINIFNEIKYEISNREMETNVPYYTDNMWYLLENHELLNEDLSWEVFDVIEPKTIEEKILDYSLIDNQYLVEIAKKIFCANNCTLIVSGRSKNIKKENLQSIILKL